MSLAVVTPDAHHPSSEPSTRVHDSRSLPTPLHGQTMTGLCQCSGVEAGRARASLQFLQGGQDHPFPGSCAPLPRPSLLPTKQPGRHRGTSSPSSHKQKCVCGLCGAPLLPAAMSAPSPRAHLVV